MENDFTEYMSQLTDKALDKVIMLKEDYQREAVIAAEAEIIKRKNFENYLQTLKEQQLIEIIEMPDEYWTETIKYSTEELKKRGSQYIQEKEKDIPIQAPAETVEEKIGKTEVKKQVSGTDTRNKYPALSTIRGILLVNAVLVLFFGVIFFFYMMAVKSYGIGFLSLLAGILIALIYWASAELIKLLIDIEYNTRKHH